MLVEEVRGEIDGVADLPSQQRMHRQTERLAGDVEQGDLNAAVDQLPPSLIGHPWHDLVGVVAALATEDKLPDRLPVERVHADQVGNREPERLLHLLATGHFTEARDTLVRLHLDDGPQRVWLMKTGEVQ